MLSWPVALTLVGVLLLVVYFSCRHIYHRSSFAVRFSRANKSPAGQKSVLAPTSVAQPVLAPESIPEVAAAVVETETVPVNAIAKDREPEKTLVGAGVS